MTDDRTENLIREALTHEASRAVDANVVKNTLARRAHRPRRRGPSLVAATVAGAAVVAVAVAAVVVPSLWSTDPVDDTMPAAERSATEPTLVVAGMDGAGHTDAVLLSRVRADGTATVSLPRDAWVDVPGHGPNRLGAAYQLGRQDALDEGLDEAAADRRGAETLLETVAALTGETPDHYVLADMSAVAAVTDAVGGVEVCVTEAHHDPASGADLEAGEQVLDGEQALAFLRQRRNLPAGDLDRMVRLQAFAESLVDSVGEADGDTVGKVVAALDGHVRADDDLDVLGLAERLAAHPTLSTATVPVGDVVMPGGVAAIEVDPKEVRAFVGPFLDGRAPEGTAPEPHRTGEARCVN
ncbi:LCP family protein [Saccharomonospora sp. NB11]|jgi:LCP family protein required for cell wall assembly|uniref:LCP family protein n=1 Tax=Saccharomonospora sp. NB11 TaxID=1642298 RepID=UPI0018D1C4F4|nr:LCP family protein [Saccharomonospora sp. NB11]